MCFASGFEQILDQISRAYFPDQEELKAYGLTPSSLELARKNRRDCITTEAVEDASIYIDELFYVPDKFDHDAKELITKKYVQSGWLESSLESLQKEVGTVFKEQVGHEQFYICDVGDDFVTNWSGAYQAYIIKPL